MTGSKHAREVSVDPPPDGEEYALYARSAVDRDAAWALMELLYDPEAPVTIDSVACTPSGDVHLSYRPGDGQPSVKVGYLCGSYIHAYGEVDGSLGTLEATATISDGERAEWRLEPEWIEAHRADQFGDEELLERVGATVEVI